MLGLPDYVGQARDFTQEVADWTKDLLSVPIPDPLEPLKDFLIKKATGIEDFEEWTNYFKEPASYINCSSVGLTSTTSRNIDRLMGLTTSQPNTCINPPEENVDVEVFEATKFAAVKNTIVLSRLLLLDAGELDKLLHDQHVGAIYVPNGWNNAILGFIGTLDGNHQWRNRAPVEAASGPKRFGINQGMPLWRDCLARDRVFRKLFKDWQNPETNQPFPNLGEGCEKISAPLPPVEFNLTPEQEHLSEPICFGRNFTAELINHKKESVTRK